MNMILGNIVTIALTKEQKKQGKENAYFIHGCNCHKKMGAGLALQVKNNFPSVYKDDVTWKKDPYYRLGNIRVVKLKNITWVNCYTQFEPGPRAEYKALESCMENLFNLVRHDENAVVYYPMIGAGIGGLDWSIAHKIIQRELIMIKKILVVYDPSSNIRL